MEISKQEHYGIDMDKTGHFFAVHIYKDPNKNEINYCMRNIYADEIAYASKLSPFSAKNKDPGRQVRLSVQKMGCYLYIS